MILAPTACPKCGDQLTAPIPSRRAGLVVQTCRRNGCGHTIWSTTPTVVLPAAPANHGQMFTPSTTEPAPPPVKAGAMQRFDRAVTAGTVRKAIQGAHKQAAAANVDDPRLRQLPGGDR